MSASKQKGTAWETACVNALRAALPVDVVYRQTLSGTQDKGDIRVVTPWVELIVECKNAVRLELAGWVDEAEKEAEHADVDLGVVWHHRKGVGSPVGGYVTMSGAAFLSLLGTVGINKSNGGVHRVDRRAPARGRGGR